MNYTEVTFTLYPFSEDLCDAFIAQLGEIGYDGFQYTADGFTAYIPEKEFDEELLKGVSLFSLLPSSYQVHYTINTLPDQDWNKIWEENFTPIVVQNRILVRAGFHPQIPGIEYDIVIEPKMSFGTGHHSTTALMLESILEMKGEIAGKQVLDMGCGTGILSILASKAGAASVTGIDIDEWAFNNAMENIHNNHLTNITIRIGNASLLPSCPEFDFILANINRNILLNDMSSYVSCLQPQGYLLMSGFYTEDLPAIREKAEKLGLSYRKHKIQNNWTAAIFYKK